MPTVVILDACSPIGLKALELVTLSHASFRVRCVERAGENGGAILRAQFPMLLRTTVLERYLDDTNALARCIDKCGVVIACNPADIALVSKALELCHAHRRPRLVATLHDLAKEMRELTRREPARLSHCHFADAGVEMIESGSTAGY
ncbi:uncharacterized protein RCC_08513 [Ramularia collo-cygni]|uniref:Uncharacterized protein n=1 Tax=Ramularia collo-cygni TaxID=112498 RepID=A0A2D3UXP4_9PEZI|nr:uncharacterized protein RCC_08513 [Ramularia collo-cygni]CZT22807.1 uncharacterized protein RCC_08513 [Ramularia collo-cygni]